MPAAAKAARTRLADECIAHLRALPFVREIELRPPRSGKGAYARLLIRTPQRRYDLPCQVSHSHLGQQAARLAGHQRASHPGLILLAPAVGRELGDALEQAEVNFVDVSGNCHLRLGDRYYVRVQGRRPDRKMRRSTGMRAPAYRLVLAFLIRPELLDAPSRAIAAEAEVSPQTAIDVRRRLEEDGIVLKSGRRWLWAPGRRKDVLGLWLAGFSASLAPSLFIGRFRASETDPSTFEQRIEPILDASCDWRYGGGAAAMRLTGHYRGDQTVLYLHDPPADLWQKLRLVRDPGGPILLAHAPGKLAFESPQARCAHPLLVYADLLAEGHDRAAEAAGELYTHLLEPSGP